MSSKLNVYIRWSTGTVLGLFFFVFALDAVTHQTPEQASLFSVVHAGKSRKKVHKSNKRKARKRRRRRRKVVRKRRRTRPMSKRRKAWFARREAKRNVLKAFLAKVAPKHETWDDRKIKWSAYNVPRSFHGMPLPVELTPRVLFWQRIFGKHPAHHVIMYDKRHFFFVGTVAVPGAGLLPGEPGTVRRRKTVLRAKAARPVLRKIKAKIALLAGMERKAERIEKRYWWAWLKQCKILATRKERRRCFKLLRIHPRLYRQATWKAVFAKRPRTLNALYARVMRDPRSRGQQWHRVFRMIHSGGLSWQSSYRAFFRKGLKVYRRYERKIHGILEEQKLPKTLAALPFVESMYNPKVRSFVGALGLWQIMPMTGKELGLYIAPKKRRMHFLPPVDERFDPLFATRAATRFIRLCRYYFKKNWPLAITSYNQGPGRILKLARRVRSRYLPHLIKRASKRKFGYDGRNFYAKFLASALLLRRMAKWFPKEHKRKPNRIVTVQLKRPYWFPHLLRMTGIAKERLLLFNPMMARLIRHRDYPIPAFFPVRMPKGRAQLLRRALARKANRLSVLTLRTGKRDTLYAFAKRFRMSTGELARWNKQLLTVPTVCDALQVDYRKWQVWRRLPWRKRKKAAKPAWGQKKRRLFRRSCQSTRKWYKRLKPGVKVVIPAIARHSKESLVVYRVRGGEPLSWISCRACTTLWHVRSLNPKFSVRRLRPGMTLRVPTCPYKRRRLYRSCYLLHYSRKRARRSLRALRRRKRRFRRSTGN